MCSSYGLNKLRLVQTSPNINVRLVDSKMTRVRFVYRRISEPMTFMRFILNYMDRTPSKYNIFAITSFISSDKSRLVCAPLSLAACALGTKSIRDRRCETRTFAAMGARSVSPFAELARNSRNRGWLSPTTTDYRPTLNQTEEKIMPASRSARLEVNRS